MAELSERDKRMLLGDDYLEAEKREREEQRRRGGAPKPEDVRARWRSWRLGGGGVAIVGALLFITHIFKGTANYDPRLSLVSAAVALVGLAFGIYAHIELGKV